MDLLCIDELGYLELDHRGAELLFQVLTEREEKASVAIASNESFSGWTKTFTGPRLCAYRRQAHLQRHNHRNRHHLLPVQPRATTNGRSQRAELMKSSMVRALMKSFTREHHLLSPMDSKSPGISRIATHGFAGLVVAGPAGTAPRRRSTRRPPPLRKRSARGNREITTAPGAPEAAIPIDGSGRFHRAAIRPELLGGGEADVTSRCNLLTVLNPSRLAPPQPPETPALTR